MKKLFLVLLFFNLEVSAQTNQIIVTGNLDKNPNTLVELRVYDDFITPVTKTVGFDHTDEAGIFSIEFNSIQPNQPTQPTQYQLIIGNISNIIHLVPGFTYSININKRLEIESIESTDPTNKLISLIDAEINKHYKIIPKMDQYDQTTLDGINQLQDRIRSSINGSNSYVTNYFRYRMNRFYFNYYSKKADSLELAKMEADIFINAPVLYNNQKYFNELSNYYFWMFNLVKVGHVPFRNDIDPLDLYLKELDFIENDTVQQIAILTACKSAYTAQWGPGLESVNQVVGSVRDASLNDKISQIADNLINKYGEEMIGEQVREFTLSKTPNQNVVLSDFYGKYLLLDFWFTGCAPCIESMPLKKKLKDQLKGQLEIISINPVDDFDRMNKWVNAHAEYDWLFLSAHKNIELKRYFRLNGYPTYYILDPDGKILFAPREFDLGLIAKQIKEVIKSSE